MVDYLREKARVIFLYENWVMFEGKTSFEVSYGFITHVWYTVIMLLANNKKISVRLLSVLRGHSLRLRRISIPDLIHYIIFLSYWDWDDDDKDEKENEELI